MNEGDAGNAVFLTQSIVLVISLCMSFLISGSISSLITSVRMRQDGLLDSQRDSRFPGERLMHYSRQVLLSLSISYLVFASLAAASLHGILLKGSSRSMILTLAGWILYFAVLIFGSIAMKALALSRPMGYLQTIRILLWMLFIVLRPVTWILDLISSRWIPSVWNIDLSPPLSGQEIRGFLADEEVSQLMEEDEAQWARSIFELSDTEIREVMVPRIDMVGLDVETPLEDAVRLAAEARFTRLPVWEENQDRILGILHTKDLLSAHARGERPSVREIIRTVHFLPESKKIDEVLQELRKGHIHLAIVVDEYGGTAGIVTLEDILEEIVGEIRDEYDEEKDPVRMIDPRKAVIDPRIDLDDLNDWLGLNLPTEESDTLAGLLYALCGKVPVRGDEVSYGDLHFTIDRVERQRICQVTLSSQSVLKTAGHRDDLNQGNEE